MHAVYHARLHNTTDDPPSNAQARSLKPSSASSAVRSGPRLTISPSLLSETPASQTPRAAPATTCSTVW